MIFSADECVFFFQKKKNQPQIHDTMGSVFKK